MARCLCTGEAALCLLHVEDDLTDEEKTAIALAWGAEVDIVKVLKRAALRADPALVGETLAMIGGLRGAKVVYSDTEAEQDHAAHEAGESWASIARRKDISPEAQRMRMREWKKRRAAERKKSRPEK
jgi:hypothetical protein